jgi:hypothetical protein
VEENPYLRIPLVDIVVFCSILGAALNQSESSTPVKTPADLPQPVCTETDFAAPTAAPLPSLTWGARNIGKVINRNETDVYYLHRTGAIPTRVVGGRLVANTAKLLAIAD